MNLLRTHAWPLALIGICLLAASLTPLVNAQTANPLYKLIIDCPQRRIGVDINDLVCPVRAWDEEDAMGSPSIAVDPRNPNNLRMASLHGSQDSNGPSERSHTSFTTFTSRDHGGSWIDNPYSPPREMNGASAEHPQIAADPYGRIFVGSLYARPVGKTGEYTWTLAAQKFKNIDQIDSSQDGAFNAQYLDTVQERNQITQYWFLFDPHTENMTVVWHEKPYQRQAPSPLSAFGAGHTESASHKETGPPPGWPAIPYTRQRASAPADLPKSLIVSATTTASAKTPYTYAADEDMIGPCSASTNPVLSEGYIYIGCVSDPTSGPFKWRPDSKAGTVELFRWDPATQVPQYLGPSPIVGGTPKLGVRSDARIALFSTQPTKEGKVLLVGAYGQFDNKTKKVGWSPLFEYANKFRTPTVGEIVVESNIQDLEYREHTGAVHLILKERVQATAAVSVDNPLGTLVKPKFVKTLVAVDERYGFLAKYDMDIGNLKNRTDPVLASNPESLYNDLSDDIVQLPPHNFTYNSKDMGADYQREFFAVGDYGFVNFAEVIEITDIRAPGVPPPLPPPVPLAAAAGALNVTSVVIWTGGLSLSSLFAAAMLANRRKNPMAAYTKGEK